MEFLSTASAEAVEAEWLFQYAAGAPPSDREILGLTARRLDGGVVLSARTDPSRYWSKALGFDGPVTARLIDAILDVYRAEATPHAMLQFAPDALPVDWEEIRLARGLRPGDRRAKLVAPIESLRPSGITDLRIGPLTADHAEAWAALVLDGFGMPHEGSLGLVAASVSHPQFFPYAAWDGDTIVAAAHLFVHDGIAALNSAVTAPTHRRRGAQSALIAARIGKARELGCRRVVAETHEALGGRVNSSTRNLLRVGMRVRYVRQSYLWDEDPWTTDHRAEAEVTARCYEALG
ncbi:GNAT family N-acetyltransferase [Actinoplanes sp. TBRC 11911]|uniref:GNAT family N-acetyltransferase n=1 Tax=Actinoplanes sp. TBRC 11911 TaxID=2729386 RepID=UPI00145F4184|nr:GNAT family N-acetyltransferase [Actinoplanes sp. TBRC 11911]NMO51746.1 GNAT family N-acetyltransferase [Actinoplanes sp. TBRC 11911]